MKTFTLALSLLPLLALSAPAPEAEPESIDKRSYTCTLTGSDVRYHTSPSTSSGAPGQFGAKGTKVVFSCFTFGSTVGGNEVWDKIASGTGKGDWVADYYVDSDCTYHIPQC